MKRLLHLLRAMSRWERWTLLGLIALFGVSLAGLLRLFYLQNTILVPTTGGTYIEGSVGELQPLNPWFTVQNDVNRDIVSLVYAGLLKYNPTTRKIEDDLATMQVSKDSRTYTLTLKENIFWHDTSSSEPHPVTADDVVFTFTTIQNPEFPNTLLQENFRGVKVEKVDARTVRFVLDEAYSFFPSNLTLGLLPQKSFDGIPVSRLDLATDFGFHPVGAGPYRVKNVVQTDLSSEVTLERFQRSLLPQYRLDRIIFRIYPDYSTLLSDLRNLQGIRLVPRNDAGDPIIPRRFQPRQYYLPQYVALFFNLDRPVLQDQKLRLGLQLGTNKQALADSIHETILVDTPLLEIDVSDWRYQFDAAAAQGALFASKWNLPEKIRLQRLLEQEEANRLGIVHAPAVVSVQSGSVLTLTGSMADLREGTYTINGKALQPIATQTGTWIVQLPLNGGTGSLKPGENLLRLVNPRGAVADSAFVHLAQDEADEKRLREEQRLVRLFIGSRAGTVPVPQRINVQNLTVENGALRLRRTSDPVSVRRNENNEPLVLRLLTSDAPEQYAELAQQIKTQWAELGVQVEIDVPATRDEFQQRLQKRDYDVVLFGQSLLDNLDSYPYWHSSGVQKLGGDAKNLRQDAYNLSQYVSFNADGLLETIRSTTNEKERADALKKLRTILKQDVPAVFLYSPLYTFAHHQDIQGIELGSLSLHSDRFLTLHKWYVRQERIFKPGQGWKSLFGWIPSLMKKTGTGSNP